MGGRRQGLGGGDAHPPVNPYLPGLMSDPIHFDSRKYDKKNFSSYAIANNHHTKLMTFRTSQQPGHF